ncbi:MAG: inner membrane protein YhjD [Pirellulaceae bacterium]|nr:MAG: inner membrane protein YhjD [Pirellulaceae bacterium]
MLPHTSPISARRLVQHLYRHVRQVMEAMLAAGRRWVEDDGSTLAAAVAYYLALSLFPLLLVVSSGFGLFLKYTHLGHDAEQLFLDIVAEHCSPALEVQIRRLWVQIRDQSILGCPIGLGTALMTALGVFTQLERALDRIWRQPSAANRSWWNTAIRVVNQRLTAFLLLLGVGGALATITVAGCVFAWIRHWMNQLDLPGTTIIATLEASTTMVFNAAIFSVLYRWLPKQTVLWSEACRAGLLVAIAWEVGRQILSICLMTTPYATTYGAIGSFILVLLWFYWGVSLILFGAEYLYALTRKRLSASPSSRSPRSPSASPIQSPHPSPPLSTTLPLPQPSATPAPRSRPRRAA